MLSLIIIHIRSSPLLSYVLGTIKLFYLFASHEKEDMKYEKWTEYTI